MSKDVTFDISEITDFFEKLDEECKAEFKKEVEKWLKDIGADFLRVVQDEVIRLEVVDTRLLLNSFHKGRKNNILRKVSKGLGIEAGTVTEYADYVNTGHKKRNGKWWEGYHYFDNAKIIFEPIFNEALQKKYEKWLDEKWR